MAANNKRRPSQLATMITEPHAVSDAHALNVKADGGVLKPTAVERLAELQKLRKRRPDGFIVDPPQTVTVDTICKWLAEVAAVGSPGDVEIAWHHIQDRMVKSQLLNEYERLRIVAGQRHYAIEEAAIRERERSTAEWRQRSELAALRREIEADEKALAAKRHKLARLSASP